MKKSRFTEEQIIGVLREQEAGMKVAEVCRKHGISEPTFYAWKAKFGGMSISDAKRLRQLEHEPVERRQRPSGGVSLAKRLPLSGRQRRCGHPRCPSLNRCARLCWCRSCGARRLRCHFAGAAAGAGVGA